MTRIRVVTLFGSRSETAIPTQLVSLPRREEIFLRLINSILEGPDILVLWTQVPKTITRMLFRGPIPQW